MDHGEQKVGEVITLRKSVNVIHKEAITRERELGARTIFEKEWMEVVFRSYFSLLSSYLWLYLKNISS